MFLPASYPLEREGRANTVEGVTKSLEGNLHKIKILPCLLPQGEMEGPIGGGITILGRNPLKINVLPLPPTPHGEMEGLIGGGIKSLETESPSNA